MSISRQVIIDYYAKRAAEYDKIYQKPERQEDIATVKGMLHDLFRGHDVLEVACGTGYWTLPLSETARNILSTDVNEEVLELAQQRSYSHCQPTFLQADAYNMPAASASFSAAFAGFWWSHIPKQRVQEFISHLHSKLEDGALVVLLDNNYVEGSNNPMSGRVDFDGDTYSCRQLSDGSCWEILKNFPTEQELRQQLGNRAHDINYHKLTYYWLLSYRVSR